MTGFHLDESNPEHEITLGGYLSVRRFAEYGATALRPNRSDRVIRLVRALRRFEP